jgi:ATP-dependent DNA helicase RecQ
MSYIIDVLRGAKTQKITLNKHDQLSTYGIGKDKTADQWRMLGRSLLHQGLLEQTNDGYSVLKLNALSWEVMRKQRQVSIAVPVSQRLNLVDVNSKALDVELLMNRLRSLRKQIADEQGFPPYMIFQDSTLKLMAQVKPKTLEEFANLDGVVSYKVSQYGEKFLSVIQSHCQEQSFPPPKNTDHYPTDTESTTLELYQQGLSIQEIAAKRNVRTTTIIRHLSDLIEKNQPVDLNLLVPFDRQKKIWQVIDVLGDISLTPIREYLGESYSFDEIRLVRARWRKENRK